MTDDLIRTFYDGLADRDAASMVDCYADDVVFEDPAFGELRGDDAKDMWRMLCANATDLSVSHTILDADETSARVNWIAEYTFGSTGRAVRNDIVATWRIVDGRIVDHRDEFDLWKWSSQALGLPGRLLGWTPMLKSKVRSNASASLAKFQSSSGRTDP